MDQLGTAPKLSGLDHERLMALINNMSDGVLALDQSARIVLSNSEALSILDQNALQGKYLQDVLNPIDKAGQPVGLQDMVLETHEPLINREWRLRYKDGSMANLFVSISPVHQGFGSDGKEGWVVLVRDITAEKSLEEERDDFISVASHELRTPVAVMEGNLSNSQLLAQKAAAPAELRHALGAAHDQIIFLSNLVNDLAMLSRADRGKLALSTEAFDVNELLDSVAHDYEPQAVKKGLSFKLQPANPATSLISSKLYVREVLQNLVTNSLKYTEKGSITLGVTASAGGVQFLVQDTGIGISRGEQKKLFTKFFRSGDWRVKKVNGTGLGLYVTSKLVSLLGGHTDVESELNRGSVFRVFVPNLKPVAPEVK